MREAAEGRQSCRRERRCSRNGRRFRGFLTYKVWNRHLRLATVTCAGSKNPFLCKRSLEATAKYKQNAQRKKVRTSKFSPISSALPFLYPLAGHFFSWKKLTRGVVDVRVTLYDACRGGGELRMRVSSFRPEVQTSELETQRTAWPHPWASLLGYLGFWSWRARDTTKRLYASLFHTQRQKDKRRRVRKDESKCKRQKKLCNAWKIYSFTKWSEK